jgi:hypothetical protein
VERDELSGANQEPLALRGEGHPARRAHEQLGVEAPLKLPDVAADRLLGHEQARRRPREVQLLRNRHEVAERADVDLGITDRRSFIHAGRMLIRFERMLDFGLGRAQPVDVPSPTAKGPLGMDPAVLGTLLIGLEDIRRDHDPDQQPIRRIARRSPRLRFVIALAGLLRSAADALEPARPDSYSRGQLSS